MSPAKIFFRNKKSSENVKFIGGVPSQGTYCLHMLIVIEIKKKKKTKFKLRKNDKI